MKTGKILTGPHEGKIGKIVGKDAEGWTVVELSDGTMVSRLPTEVEEIKTVDITPSWPAVLHIMLAVLDNKKASREGRQAVIDNLKQMAQVAQMYTDLNQKGLPAAIQLKYTYLYQYGDLHEVIINFPDGQVRTLRIEEHQLSEYVPALFTEEPEFSGAFNQNKLYTK